MTTTLYDALKSSRNPYMVGLLKQVATSDEMFSTIPFIPKGGESFSYEREVSLGNFSFIAPGGSVSQSTGTTERIAISNVEATEDLYVDNFVNDNQNGDINPLERQTMMKMKAAGRAIANKIINGGRITTIAMENFQGGAYVTALVAASAYIRDREGPGEIKYTNAGTLVQFRAPGDLAFGPAVTAAANGTYTLYSDSPSKWIKVTLTVAHATGDAIRRIVFSSTSNEFDGLAKIVSPSQTIASTGANGDTISFPILDQLLDQVKVRTGNLAYVMNLALRRNYNTLVRSLGGNQPEFVLGNGMRVPTFNGIPILANDWIPSTESKGTKSNLTSCYLVNFGADDGVYMGALGGQSFDVNADPRNATVLGFRVRDLGQLQSGGSKVGRRVTWYGALACGSDYSVARASELVTT